MQGSSAAQGSTVQGGTVLAYYIVGQYSAVHDNIMPFSVGQLPIYDGAPQLVQYSAVFTT